LPARRPSRKALVMFLSVPVLFRSDAYARGRLSGMEGFGMVSPDAHQTLALD